jgi:hypothetical protein
MFVKDNSLLESTTNFQIFMTIMTEQETREKKNAVLDVFTLLFPSYKVSFTPRSILFNQSEGNFMIDENNFEIL